MDRCNELCTKETTGTCKVCDALADRERFEHFWLKGVWFITRSASNLLSRFFIPLYYLYCVGFLAFLVWAIPHSHSWRFTIAPFLQTNPPVVIVLIAGAVLPLFWLILWKLPQSQVKNVYSTKDRLDLEAKARQTLGQILGGAALLVGLYFTSQTLWTTQEGQITDRFTKAIEQLGKDSLAVRLGGIYALERIARDSETDHWPVMEVLTAFVREHPYKRPETLWAWITPLVAKASKPQESEVLQPPLDIQAILTVIGRRASIRRQGEVQRIDLHNAHLQGAVLRNAQLDGVDLEGAHLASADLSWAHLEYASLKGAHLQGASLSGTHLQGADLRGADLQGAVLIRTHLEGADLRDVTGLFLFRIEMACLDEKTRLSEDILRPRPCR